MREQARMQEVVAGVQMKKKALFYSHSRRCFFTTQFSLGHATIGCFSEAQQSVAQALRVLSNVFVAPHNALRVRSPIKVPHEPHTACLATCSSHAKIAPEVEVEFSRAFHSCTYTRTHIRRGKDNTRTKSIDDNCLQIPALCDTLVLMCHRACLFKCLAGWYLGVVILIKKGLNHVTKRTPPKAPIS